MQPVIHKKLRKDKLKDGKCPVILQIYYNNLRKQIFTGLFIEEKYWDNNKEQSILKAPNAEWFNRVLNNKFKEIEEEYFKQSATTGSIDINQTKKQSRQSFFEYGIKMYEGMKNTASPEYINKAKIALKDFKDFAGEQTLQSITAQLLRDFQDHLFKEGKERNTINGKFKRLKQVYKQAKKEKLTDHNPFDMFQAVTYKQPKRNFLTVDEIRKLESSDLPKGLEHIRNYFLLSCHIGLRFGDVKAFDKKQYIVNNNGVERIIINTEKMEEPVTLKLSDNVKSIIEKLDKPLPSNVHTNRLLKVIGVLSDIKKPLSFHLSRHTAAVNMAAAGIPIEAVAKILGHSSIRSTAIYYKITDTKVDEYMDIYGKFLDRNK